MSPTAAPETETLPETIFQFVSHDALAPSPLNPRKHFDPVKLGELAASMGNGVGVIEPLVVRPRAKGIPPYEIVAGERRWRAAGLAGLDLVPVLVRELTDAQVLELMVIENDQREDINPLEEGDGFKRLMTFGFDIDHLANRIGRTRRYIYDRVKLLEAIPRVQELLLGGRITVGHAIPLSRLTPAQQEKALVVSKRNGYGSLEGPLFEQEDGLWTDEERKARKGEPLSGLKVRSVRELQAWIDQHCRFDAREETAAELFPATTEAIEEAEKVIFITHNHHVDPDAKEGNPQRIFSVVSWKRADGLQKSKSCAHAVTGVIVVGPGRGEAFKVCTNKDKCATHWGAEQREKKRRAAGTTTTSAGEKQRQAREQERRATEEAARQTWDTAVPAMARVLLEKVKAAPVASLVTVAARRFRDDGMQDAAKLLPKPKTAEDFLRLFALGELLEILGDSWFGPRDLPTVGKAVKFDTAAELKKATAALKQTAPPAAAKKTRPRR